MAFPDGTADFRSDTVTQPTEEMRRAMAEAEVGDDVYGEDPTINRLEQESAEVVGKEAALFVPSGTMGNQIAVNLHTRPGDEVLCVDWAHVRNFEHGAAAVISGVAFRNVGGQRGTITREEAESALVWSGRQLPAVSLLVWENTHNASGGSVLAQDVVEQTSAAVRERGLAVHLDGARLFNAAVASGRPASELAAMADSVMFCFSKGLRAPVGSILCGPAGFIGEARRVRERLGGAMRQTGVIASAALVGLRQRDRLAEDHTLARRLAEMLSERFPAAVPRSPDTNMVLVDGEQIPGGAEGFRQALAAKGVLVGYIRPGILRFVTHGDVDAADVERVGVVASGLA